MDEKVDEVDTQPLKLLRSSASYWAKLSTYLSYLGGILLLILAIMVSTDIVVRWILGRPILGVFEISELLLIATTFIVLPAVQYSGQQLRVDILSSKAKGRLIILLALLDGLVALIFFAVLLSTSMEDLWEAINRNLQGRGMLQIPLAVPLAFVVFGSVAVVAAIVIGIVRDSRSLKRNRNK